MLEAGQPIHAFDLDRVAGHRLTVAPATASRSQPLTTRVRTSTRAMSVSVDDEGRASIAGG